MDSGLRVQWPLSPYATALAAGALVGFCVALWKHCAGTSQGTGKDPSGQKSGSDLDTLGKEDVADKKKKEEREAERTHFPDLVYGDVKPPDYESLCSAGRFGAIPRTTQRNHALQTPQLYSALRRRNVEKGSKSWHDINPVSSNFSCIYQQSFSFGYEVPRLNARLVLNVSPCLNQYLKQFSQLRDFQLPEYAKRGAFDDFDVSINPEILKDKPITRSAVRLTLQRQLHRILGGELLGEIKVDERGIQTADILEVENKNDADARSQNDQNCNLELKSDTVNDGVKSDSVECSKRITANSSLWDSGYCEKSFDERCSTPREYDNDENIDSPIPCRSHFSTESSEATTVITVKNNSDSSRYTSINYSKHDKLSEYADKYTDALNDSKNILGDFEIEKNKILHDSIENINCKGNMSELSSTELEISMGDNGTNLGGENNTQPVHGASDVNNEAEIRISAENKIDSDGNESMENLSSTFRNLDLEQAQETSLGQDERTSDDGKLLPSSGNILEAEKNQDFATRALEVDVGRGEDAFKSILHSTTMKLEEPNLEDIQNALSDSGKENGEFSLSAAIKVERNNSSRVLLESDVTGSVSSRDSAVFDERETRSAPRQMDRETGERSVAVESSVTTETTLRDARLSTAVVSRVTVDDWSADREDSVSVKTTISEEIFRPTFEEFIPLTSGAKKDAENVPFEIDGKRVQGSPSGSQPSSPRVDRLKGLLNRDEERRSRTKFHHLATEGSHVGGAMEGEWDRLLRDVLASVSELERWERRQCDVRSDAEDAEQHPSFSQSDSSFTMEEEALSPSKGETPTKVKSLRFKLDPDVFDVPSDDSFYDDDDDEVRRGWKKQSKYRAFSTLELTDEPVRLVSVHASVVPAGQKMVARPVGIDLRVRLTEERQSKRAHVSTSPSQAKRRSPVSDRGIGWCQELSPVTENVDWRETFTPVTPECKSVPNGKTVPNGILKTPSPKSEPQPVESPNPFKIENGVTTNGLSPVIEQKTVNKPKYNGLPWRPIERKPFSLPRKKFEPDPEAIERITGYKSALSKPPLPPPIFDRINASKIAAIKKAELARKQYLDSKAALSANKVDGTKKFQQFLNQAQNDRARIVTSVPDLVAIERAVTEQWMKERASVSPRESPGRENCEKAEDATLSRGSTPDDKWASYVQSCRQHLGRRSQSMTYLETDIDIIPVLDEDDKCASTGALDESDEALPDPDDSDIDESREDLDDSGRAKSEHELRIERSLRSMPVPDWYRRSEKPKTGFLLGSSAKEKRGWAAAKSLASSTSSLASCGLRRPVRSLRSSRENIPWSRSSASPDGPTLSLALAKAFREPYLGWRARTPTSSGVSSSPRASPPSWGATTTDDEANGVSFDGEDAFGRTTSSEEDRRDEPLSLDDTGADAVTVSMDTNDPVKLPCGEDTCDDINNMSMDTCELFDASVVVPVDEDPSPQADTGDDIDNLSTDTTTEGRKLDPKLKRYSYSQSIYHSEWEEEEESRGDRKVKDKNIRELSSASPDHKVVWIESSFVGSRTTTSILVLPESGKENGKVPGSNIQERPASR